MHSYLNLFLYDNKFCRFWLWRINNENQFHEKFSIKCTVYRENLATCFFTAVMKDTNLNWANLTYGITCIQTWAIKRLKVIKRLKLLKGGAFVFSLKKRYKFYSKVTQVLQSDISLLQGGTGNAKWQISPIDDMSINNSVMPSWHLLVQSGNGVSIVDFNR